MPGADAARGPGTARPPSRRPSRDTYCTAHGPIGRRRHAASTAARAGPPAASPCTRSISRRAAARSSAGQRPDVAANAEHPLHRHVEAKLQRRHATGLLIGHVGDPVDHRARRVRVAVAVLDLEPVGGVGVVAGPDLVGPAQDAQIGPAATAGARLDQQVRETRPASRASRSYTPRTWRTQTSRCWPRLLRPADFGPGAVVVPLDEVDACRDRSAGS